MTELSPQQVEQARTLLDTVPALHWELRVEYPAGEGTWSGSASHSELRAAQTVLAGISGYPPELLDGIEAELRKALDQVAAARCGEIPTPTVHLTVEP